MVNLASSSLLCSKNQVDDHIVVSKGASSQLMKSSLTFSILTWLVSLISHSSTSSVTWLDKLFISHVSTTQQADRVNSVYESNATQKIIVSVFGVRIKLSLLKLHDSNSINHCQTRFCNLQFHTHHKYKVLSFKISKF